MQAVWGQKFAPALLDRYLASKGFEPQMADEPNDQHGRVLFAPLPGDPGARSVSRAGTGRISRCDYVPTRRQLPPPWGS